MSSEESSINTAIVACFDSVLHQADEVIQDAAIDKLEKYLKGNLFDPSIFILALGVHFQSVSTFLLTKLDILNNFCFDNLAEKFLFISICLSLCLSDILLTLLRLNVCWRRCHPTVHFLSSVCTQCPLSELGFLFTKVKPFPRLI